MSSEIKQIGVDRPLPEDVDYLNFRFKPFKEMTDEDYAFIGFRSGLEIHQQLLTKKKLFCRCPAGQYSSEFDAEILRHMRPTLSELGEYDGTALMEFKTHKEILYHINRDTVCTYEMDDTPPFELNEEALDNALEIGLLYKCSLVDEIHIARKQYLDGSIPTGFQRTTIVGLNGSIPFKDRIVDIVQLGLEEDSCREFSDIDHRRVYLTDRLGIPLIETVTAPQMITPDEVAEVGEILRKLTRSTGKVRTGLGAGRQDVNVSVHGGTRIEIKGVPRLPSIPRLTYNEAMRQFNLLRLRAELNARGVTPETFSSQTEDVTRIVSKTKYQPIHDAVKAGKMVRCVKLSGFKGLLNWQTQTDTYFSREISDRVRVIACLTTLPNIVHSDSMTDTLTTAKWKEVRKAMNAEENDAVVLVWGDSRDTETGAKEIIIRAQEATVGIPSETRQALSDGTNGFERILPGADRMYPDTDLPPKRITDDRISTCSSELPEYFWKRQDWYRDLGVLEDCIDSLSISRFADLFKKLVEEDQINPKFLGVVFVQFMKRLRKNNVPLEDLTVEMVEKILLAHKTEKIAREGLLDMLALIACKGDVLEENLPKIPSEEEVETVVTASATEAVKLTPDVDGSRHRLAMRLAMASLKGRYSGNKLATRVAAALRGLN
ncbi:MAG: Glu-tRNA(Gln) amidotransferase subunit GatE [Calditrichaeota bacterium]|nr:Glu-tRNA(Gln) amidotransferase subunit GatE [Calditrichota bacterium]